MNKKEELIYWAKRLYYRGLSPATSGNISVLGEDNKILISSSGSCLGDLVDSDIVTIDFDGTQLSKGKKASGEKHLHSAIYEARPDVEAVIHSHCPYITAFAVAGVPIKDAILPEFVYQFGEIPIAKYATPSSFELVDNCLAYFKKGHNIVLMKNHGVIIAGPDLRTCFMGLESVRAYAETYFGAMVLGGVQKLNAKQISEINKLKG
ncbi:class II aldolase/adducin family protein [bacterium]|nr:class II aldolase/adducin family protein [bacterium]